MKSKETCMSKLRSQTSNEIHTDIGPIERMPIAAISLPDRLLRSHSDRNKKQYARCIEALGLISPIIVDASGVIVVGTHNG
jgi:ParB-like chromosome segregation protein Spo0J